MEIQENLLIDPEVSFRTAFMKSQTLT